jgi:large subunit ribosomal protein L15
MMIHDITAQVGKYKARKRVGRGTGSGTGRRSGRGQKGASSRSGHASKLAFEGGQMPYFRRLRKFGFSNFNFTTRFWIVNLRAIATHPMFAKGGEVTLETLMKAGLVRDDSRDLKILGDMAGEEKSGGKLGIKLTITASRVSASARKLVEAAGGKVTETGSRRDMVRGIDRQSGDPTPKNLTKKLKRGRKATAAPATEAASEGKDTKAPKEAKAPKPAKDASKDAGKDTGKDSGKKGQ